MSRKSSNQDTLPILLTNLILTCAIVAYLMYCEYRLQAVADILKAFGKGLGGN